MCGNNGDGGIDFETEWSDFKDKYNKVYSDAAEAKKRFEIFRKNAKDIEEFNKGENLYT